MHYPISLLEDNAAYMSYVKLFTLTLFSTLFINAYAQPPSRGRAIEMLIAGDNSLQMLDLEKAIDFYNQAIGIDPSFADAYMKRSNAYAIAGRNTEAQVDYNKALELNPYIDYLYDSRAKIKVMIADFKGSFIDIDKTALVQPQETNMVQKMVQAQMRNQYPGSIAQWDSLISSDQTKANYYLNRALALWESDEPNSAMMDIADAIKLDPNSATAYNVLGLLHIELGNYDDAIEAFTKALELNGKYTQAYFNRGRAYNLAEDNEPALADLNIAIKQDTSYTLAYFSRAMVYKSMGNTGAAISDYSKVIEQQPTLADAYFSRGFSRKKMGDYTGARRDYDQVLVLTPNEASAYNNRGVLKVIADDLFGAEKDFRMAISLMPDYAVAYHNLGMCLIMNHSRNEGCSQLQTSLNKGIATDKNIFRYFCAQ